MTTAPPDPFWDGGTPDGVRSSDTTPGDPDAWGGTVAALGDITEAARALAAHAPAGCAYQVERNTAGHVVALIVALQDVRRDIGQVEAYLSREVGRDPMLDHKGVLPDGRAYEVAKGQVRRAWDHAAWRGDVRAQVLSGVGTVVDTGTGEEVDLQALLAAAQEAHGAGAPRVTVLRTLGLDPDEYAESVPGPWSVRVVGDAGPDAP